jgi:hypothetical protein
VSLPWATDVSSKGGNTNTGTKDEKKPYAAEAKKENQNKRFCITKMQDITCLYRKEALVIDQSSTDDMADEFRLNQPVRCKVTRISKSLEPSVAQNGLLHACIKLVADNARDKRLNTPAKVKFACKVALDFRHQDRVAVRPDGEIVFEYRSFSFAELRNMERLNVFERAFEWLANIDETRSDQTGDI